MTGPRFSLLEVLLAIVILSLLIGGAMAFTSQASADVIRSRRDWEATHALSLATEYFLLAPPRASVPHDLLPEGYSAECRVEQATSDLPEFAQAGQAGWTLARYVIDVHDGAGATIGHREVIKVVREDDL